MTIDTVKHADRRPRARAALRRARPQARRVRSASARSSAAVRRAPSWPCTRSCGASTARTSRARCTCGSSARRRRRPTSCSSASARTPASSTSATAGPSPSRSRRTTTRRTSSRTRARPPASAASCATSSRWARARSPSWTRCASVRSTPPTPSACCRASSPASAATATASACRTSAARSSSTRRYLGNPLVNALCVGAMRHEDIHLASAKGAGNHVVLYGARTGGDGIGGVSVLASETFDEGGPDQAPERAGRRPVHGEAAHRGLPRGAARRAGRGHPGPRRRRHLLRDERAGLQRRGRHARLARPRAAARPHALAGGDPHERVAGAHVRDRHAGEPRRVPRALRASGTSRPSSSARSPTPAASPSTGTASRSSTCRRAPSRTRARSTSARTHRPPWQDALQADGPERLPRPQTSATSCARPCCTLVAAPEPRLEVLGHRRSTTATCSATPCWRSPRTPA